MNSPENLDFVLEVDWRSGAKDCAGKTRLGGQIGSCYYDYPELGGGWVASVFSPFVRDACLSGVRVDFRNSLLRKTKLDNPLSP